MIRRRSVSRLRYHTEYILNMHYGRSLVFSQDAKGENQEKMLQILFVHKELQITFKMSITPYIYIYIYICVCV